MGMDIVFIDLGDGPAKGILKAEMAKRGISSLELTSMLVSRGMKITRAAIDNRISRGTFSADFMIEALKALGCKSIALVNTDTI